MEFQEKWSNLQFWMRNSFVEIVIHINCDSVKYVPELTYLGNWKIAGPSELGGSQKKFKKLTPTRTHSISELNSLTLEITNFGLKINFL